MNKKITVFYLLIIFTIVLTFSACGTKDLTKGKSPDVILKEAYEKLAQLDNFEMDFLIKTKLTPPGQETIDMDIKGKGTFFQEPLLVKMSMELKDPETAKMVNIEQYVEEQEKETVVYQGLNNQWYKIKIKDPAFSELIKMDPRKSLELYINNLEKAEILKEENINGKETLKIEMVISGELYDTILKQLPAGDLASMNLPLETGLLNNIGKIKGIVWVDKNLNVIKTYIDMTENINKLGKAIIENGNLPADVSKFFETMEMSVEYQIKNQNKAREFNIPDSAKNAQEMPLFQ